MFANQNSPGQIIVQALVLRRVVVYEGDMATHRGDSVR